MQPMNGLYIAILPCFQPIRGSLNWELSFLKIQRLYEKKLLLHSALLSPLFGFIKRTRTFQTAFYLARLMKC